MKHPLLLLSLMLSAAWAGAAPADKPAANTAAPASGIAFALVKTSEVTTQEGLTYDGGSLFKTVGINHMAVLVQHPQGSFLFDTGLGRKIDEQYHDMPWWGTFLFRYDPKAVSPARDQLDKAGFGPVPRVILSHSHWDHASGLVDFPEAEIWVTPEELGFLRHAKGPGNFPSEVSAPSIRWRTFGFEAKPYEGFAQSLDLFRDGSAVLVPLPGHTPGSVGLFLTLASGKQYFFCGDLVWNANAFKEGRGKASLASRIVDNDRPETLRVVQQIAALKKQRPELVIVPAHDAAVQSVLGYFPRWVR